MHCCLAMNSMSSIDGVDLVKSVIPLALLKLATKLLHFTYLSVDCLQVHLLLV